MYSDFNWFLIIILHTILFIHKEDRHVALTAQSAVNATWRVGLQFEAPPIRENNGIQDFASV